MKVMRTGGNKRSLWNKDGKIITWVCPDRCECKYTKVGEITVQLMSDCEMNPTIESEEIEI